MKDLDLVRFTMDGDGGDNNDYDEYEEEVIERDEYDDSLAEEEEDDYEDEEPYEDDGYDDGYDDYDDQPEEEYDGDGYDDQYYDDRLNKVLDELAELKRGMAAPAVVQPQPIPQQIQSQPMYSQPQPFIYSTSTTPPVVQNGGNEVVMYNEISRLRDELSKTQSSQSLHIELSRLKDEMEKEQKQNESQFLAEIRRLNEKIETLQKNGEGPQSDNPGAPVAAYEGVNTDRADFDKLIAINEAILRTSKEVDGKIQGEIAAIKKQLASMPDFNELTRSVQVIRKNAKPGISDEELKKLTEEIGRLRSSIKESGLSGGRGDSDKLMRKLDEAAEAAKSLPADNTDVLAQLFELKSLIGSPSAAGVRHNAAVTELYNQLKKVKFDAASKSVSFGEKLASAYNFGKILSETQEADTAEIADALNAVIASLAAQPLTRQTVDGLAEFADKTGLISFGSSKRETAARYLTRADKLMRDDIADVVDVLPDAIADKNTLQGNKNELANEELYSEIMTLNADLMFASDDAKIKAIKGQIKEALSGCLALKVGEVSELPAVTPARVYKSAKAPEEALFDKIDLLKEAISARPSQPAQGDGADGTRVLAEISALKEEISKVGGGSTDDLSIAVLDLKNDYLDIIERLTGITEALQGKETATAVEGEATGEEAGDVQFTNNELSGQLYDVRDELTHTFKETTDAVQLSLDERMQAGEAEAAQRQAVIDDLEFIKTKLSEHEEFINQIGDLRADVLSVPAAIDFTTQFDKLYEDVYAQIDKLYEDLSEHFNGALAQSQAQLSDTVNNGVIDINSRILEVKDAVEGGNSLDLENALLDSITTFRADFDAFTGRSSETDEAATADRIKLLDDIAYIRQQIELEKDAEAAQAEMEEQEEPEDPVMTELAAVRERIDAGLGEISERFAALELAATTADTEKKDDYEQLSADLTAVKDMLDIIATDPAKVTMSEDLAAVREGQQQLADTVAANHDAATDVRNVILDDLAFIKEQVTPAAEPADDPVAAIGDNVSLILDDLTDVLTRLESLEKQSAGNRDSIVSHIDDVKEQIHLKELDANLTAVTASDEERQTLLKEIAEIRERLAAVEDTVVDKTETETAQLTLIMDQITDLKSALERDPEPDEKVAEINEKVDRLLDESAAASADAENINIIIGDIAEIKEKLAGSATGIDFDKIADDLGYIRAQVESNLSQDDDGELNESIASEDLSIILDDLASIKEKLNVDGEGTLSYDDVVAEILSLREDVKAARIVDQNDVSSELEAVKNELAALGTINVLDEIRALRDEIAVYKEEAAVAPAAEAPTNDELNMLLSEIVSLRDEVQSYKDDMTAIVTKEQEEEPPAAAEPDENITIILDELTAIRSEFQGLRDESKAEQEEAALKDNFDKVQSELTTLKDDITELKDIISRRTTLAAETPAEGLPASNELNVVLDEIINLKGDIDNVSEQIQGNNVESILADVQDIKAQIADLMLLTDETGEEDKAGEEIRNLKAELTELIETHTAPELAAVVEDLQILKNQLADIQVNQAMTSFGAETPAERTEIITELSAIKEQLAASAESGVYDELAALREDIDAIRASVQSGVAPAGAESDAGLMTELLALRDNLDEIKANLTDRPAPETAAITESDGEGIALLRGEIAELKDLLSAQPADETLSVMTEVLALRDELTGLKETLAQPQAAEAGPDMSVLTEVLALRDELTGLKESLAQPQTAESGPDMTVLTEVLALRDELTGLKESLAQPQTAEAGPDMSVLTEVLALRDELTGLKETLAQPLAAEPEADLAVMTEVMALRDEFNELKNTLGGDSRLDASLDQIREDVRAMKEEPDLSVLNEILALRDEFQNLKEEIDSVKTAAAAKENEAVIGEVQQLRDQLFAISMANVNDGTSKEGVYESYNNIILDEITALREEMASIKAADMTSGIADELNDLRSKLELRAADNESIIAQLNKVKTDIESLKNLESSDATNNAVLGELANLREELSNQREADMTTLNFMSEMAHLLERQNQYISQSAGSKITDEIESLKAEIASTLTAPQNETGAIMEEIAKLKEELSQGAGEPIIIDNQEIVDELAKLKEELSREKPSQENLLILQEISRLKDEISAFAEKEKQSDLEESAEAENLSRSISDLKQELTQIADMVSDDEEPKKAPQKPKSASKPRTGAKTGSKSGTKSRQTGAKTASKPKPKTTAKKAPQRETLIREAEPEAVRPEPVPEETNVSGDELISKIEATSIEIPKIPDMGDEDFNPNLDFNYTPSKNTSDDLDLASKLAKQVANKLIMEQLVQQLGDGGVPRSRVEEIVKDILPQEFSTVQIDEQSDQVRRLANQLVLDKLRSRLTGKK